MDPSARRWLSPHLYAAPPPDRDQGILTLILPGTRGEPAGYTQLALQAARLGSHVVALRYPNDTAINELAGNDPSAHWDLRLDHWDGGDRTGRVRLEPGESILERLAGAIRKLSEIHPEEGWGRFLDQGEPAWDRISAVGHSLGGGYAALAARKHRLKRAVVFGWADWCRESGELAEWTRDTFGWPTPATRRFSLRHERDEMIEPSVGRESAGRFLCDRHEEVVESNDPPWGRRRGLVTDLDPGRERVVPQPCHNSLALDASLQRWPDSTPVLADAWTWLLAGEP